MSTVGVATIQVVIGGNDWSIQLPPATDLTDTELIDRLTALVASVKGLLSNG